MAVPQFPADLYRSDETGDYSLNPGKGKFLMHSDDHLDGRTEIHLFSTFLEAEAFRAGFIHACKQSETDVETTLVESTPDHKHHGFVVEFLDIEHPENERDPLTYVHPCEGE